MARRKKNLTQFQDYERTREDNGYEVDYIRMVDLQLICMNELSANAFRLYIMMKAYANGNAEFEYPHRIYKQFLSNQTFINARQELIDKGYLYPFVSNKNLRTQNKYKFSSSWRVRNKENIDSILELKKQKKSKEKKETKHQRL